MISSIEVELEGCGDPGRMAACELRIIAPVVTMEAHTVQQKTVAASKARSWEKLETGPKVSKLDSRKQKTAPQGKELDASKGIVNTQNIENAKNVPKNSSPIFHEKNKLTNVVVKSRTSVNGSKTGKTRQGVTDCSITLSNGQPQEIHGKKTVFVSAMKTPGTAECEDKRHCDRVKTKCWNVKEDAVGVRKGPDAMVLPLTDDLQTQTWHGRTRGSEERRSRSSSRQSTRRASQNKHRGSLDSKALPFCSDSLKTECEQTTSSVPTLSPREPASLLDVMHKKYCSQQYSLDKRARSMDMLHTIPGVPIMGLVHAHSDHAVHKAMPIWPPTPAMFIVPPATERAGKLKKVGRKSSRFPVSLPKGQGHRSRKRDQAELEAAEACTWLRAAGFPQYAQVYEDGLFPLELTSVEVDHDFLDADSIQSLLRRLNTLNKCAQMKVEAPSRKLTDDSDEEEQCALSDKWKYMRTSRRWSRKDLDTSPYNVTLQTLRSASSHDSLLTDPESVGGMAGDDGETTPPKQSTLTTDGSLKMKRSTSGSFIVSPRLRRAASERIKSARNLLKRVESFKKRKKANPEISQISQPVVVDSKEMQARIQHLNCKEITPGADSDTSPTEHKSTAVSGLMSTSSDDVSDNSRTSPEVIERAKDLSLPDRPNCVSSQERINSLSNGCPGATPSPQFPPLSHTEMDSSTQAISTAAHAAVQNRLSRRSHRASQVAGSPETPHRVVTHTEVPSQTYLLPEDYVPGSFPKQLGRSETDPQPVTRVRLRTVSGTSADHNSTENHRASVYDNVLTDNELAAAHRELDLILHDLFQDINSLSQVLNSSENDTTGDTSEGTLPPLESDDSLTKPSGPGHEVVDIGTLSSQGECGTVSSQGECGTVSSHGECGTVSSHGECGTASSRDASEPEGSRERRDSGVGSSLTRAPSDRRRTRIRWHSFQKSHRPSFNSRNLQIEGFSAGQLMVLRKLALLKLTAIMEKYSPVNRTGWNWVVTRLMKKPKAPDYKDKNMFGVPLLVTLQRTGQPIPQCLLYAMRFLRKTSKDAVGIFRKSGVRSRIQKLRNDLEEKPDLVDSLDELQAYDVADLLKQYFRELPECLLTNKLSETFISIFTYVPVELRLEALQSAVILMPDENREVLQSLLLFLSDIALSSNEHQMTASNLAVCFAPSLFSICGPRNLPPTASPRTKRSNNNNNNNKGLGVPDQRELLDQKAAHECLTMMITQCKQLFMISADTLTRCRFSYMEEGEPVSLEELCKTDELSAPDVTAYIDSCIKGILKESREKFKSWTSLPGVEGVELAYKKVGDGHPLRLWKCSVEVEAPPTEVLNRILAERFMWDEDLLQWKTVEKINNQTDVFQYVRNSMAPHPTRDYCVLRSWRTDLPKGACVLVSTSIDHPGAPLLGGVRGVVLASRFLIEPCGSGKSRLTHLSRIDMRGKGPEYYVKVYGHICSNFMGKIKGSFKHGDDISQGPETKV